jgi:hypothetical protein
MPESIEVILKKQVRLKKRKEKGWLYVRYVLIILFSYFTVIFLLRNFGKVPLSVFGIHLSLDYGGVSSLLATLVIVLFFRIDSEMRDTYKLAIVGKDKQKENSMGIVVLALGIAALIGIWLAIRTIGVFVNRYVGEQDYTYLTSDVFSIIGFILLANLCFTLQRTLVSARQQRIQGLITAPIQAIIIGLITILPRYNDAGFLSTIGEMNGYVALVAVLVAALVALCLLWAYLKSLGP